MACFSTLESGIPSVFTELGPLMFCNGTHELKAELSGSEVPPGPDCEVFFNKLPEVITLEHLALIARKCGRLYGLRMMHEFGGEKRGYAFVTYFCPKDAQRAVYVLNHMIVAGATLHVEQSYNKRVLFAYGFDRTLAMNSVRLALYRLFPLASKICIIKSKDTNYITLGRAFIIFPNHIDALHAKKKYNVGVLDFFGQELYICWARGNYFMNNDNESVDPNTLVIRSIPSSFRRRYLMTKIFHHIDSRHVSGYFIKGDVLYLKFYNVHQKHLAANSVHEIIIAGNRLYTDWAGFQEELFAQLVYNYDNILRLKCIANAWRVPIVIVGEAILHHNVQLGAIVMRCYQRVSVIFFEIFGDLTDIRARMQETVVRLIIKFRSFPMKNYVVSIQNYVAEIVGEIPHLGDSVLCLSKDWLPLNNNLSEFWYLKTAIHLLITRTGLDIDELYHGTLTNRPTNPIIDIQMPQKIFFCLRNDERPNSRELSCDLSRKRLNLVLCNRQTGNNFTQGLSFLHGFAICARFTEDTSISLLYNHCVDQYAGFFLYPLAPSSANTI